MISRKGDRVPSAVWCTLACSKSCQHSGQRFFLGERQSAWTRLPTSVGWADFASLRKSQNPTTSPFSALRTFFAHSSSTTNALKARNDDLYRTLVTATTRTYQGASAIALFKRLVSLQEERKTALTPVDGRVSYGQVVPIVQTHGKDESRLLHEISSLETDTHRT